MVFDYSKIFALCYCTGALVLSRDVDFIITKKFIVSEYFLSSKAEFDLMVIRL